MDRPERVIGCWTITFPTTSLANGEDPTALIYDPSQLRDHLRSCMESGKMTPFPSKPCRARSRGEKVQQEDVFCYCRRTDFGPNRPDSLKMVGCDKQEKDCVLWVHKMQIPRRR